MSGLELAGIIAGFAVSGIAGIGTIANFVRTYKENKKKKKNEEKQKISEEENKKIKESEKKEIELMRNNIQNLCTHLGFFASDMIEDKIKDMEEGNASRNLTQQNTPIETPSEFELEKVVYNRKDNVVKIYDEKYNRYTHKFSENVLPYS